MSASTNATYLFTRPIRGFSNLICKLILHLVEATHIFLRFGLWCVLTHGTTLKKAIK